MPVIIRSDLRGAGAADVQISHAQCTPHEPLLGNTESLAASGGRVPALYKVSLDQFWWLASTAFCDHGSCQFRNVTSGCLCHRLEQWH